MDTNYLDKHMARKTVQLKHVDGSSDYYQLVWKGDIIFIGLNRFDGELDFMLNNYYEFSDIDIADIKEVIDNHNKELKRILDRKNKLKNIDKVT